MNTRTMMRSVMVMMMMIRAVVATPSASIHALARRISRVSSHRRLQVSNATARELEGGVGGTGTLWMSFELAGDQRYELIVDTGSSMTYLPCKGCEGCGTHQAGAYYDYDRSPDFRALNCSREEDSSACAAMSGTCSRVGERAACEYELSYQEGSSSRGYVVEDVVHFGGTVSNATVMFGCEVSETNLILAQRADGLFGLGADSRTTFAQMVRAGAIENVFSMCVDGFGTNGGVMTLGRFDFGDADDRAVSTPLTRETSTFYETKARRWKLGDVELKGSTDVTTIIDSGTTFTYLPRAMHAAFADALENASTNAGLVLVDGADPQYEDVCYDGGSALTEATVGEFFPSLTIDYDDDAAIELGPENYLFAHETNAHAFCLGVFADYSWNKILLGQITMRDTLVTFDVGANRVNMTRLSCRELQQRYVGANETSSPPTASPSPPPSPPPPSPPPPSTTSTHTGSVWPFVVVGLGGTAAALGGPALARRLRAQSANDRQWRRFEEDTLDAQIELIDLA